MSFIIDNRFSICKSLIYLFLLFLRIKFPANENELKCIKIFLIRTSNPWKWIEWIEMDWILADISLIFEKKMFIFKDYKFYS